MTPENNEKWQAVLHCDESFDGQFFYGVKTTGIFCRPSCKSKSPLPENVEFFDSSAAAYACGLRPCKRCRPDLLEYKPMQELLLQVKNLYDTDFSDREKLSSQLRQLPASLAHLTRLFRQEFGVTPSEYLSRLRTAKAMGCLANTPLSILEIAYVCGFGSLSRFYTCFKKQIGITPNRYRRQTAQNQRCSVKQ